MHAPGFWQLLIVLGLAFVLFGRPGRISSMMEDLGKGIRGFKKGLAEPENTPAQPAAPATQIPDQSRIKDDERAGV